VTKIYVVLRAYGSDSADGCGQGPEKYGRPFAAFDREGDARQYAQVCGMVVTEVDLL
jgi:hypothetical protein